MSEGSRTSNSMKNIRFGLINKLVTMLLSFISRRLFLEYIGIELLGINGLFAEVLGVLSLADLGFGTAMTYSFYKPVAENDKDKIAALITFYRKVYNTIAFAVAVIGIALIPFMDLIVKTDAEIPNLVLYYLVFLTNTVVSYLFAYKASVITASQKEYLVSKYQVWISIAKTVLEMVIVIATHNYLMYICVSIVATVASNLLISRKATQLYPVIKEKKELPKEEKKKIFENLGSVFLYKLSSTLLNSTDNTLISIICGTVFVGFYANYKTITTSINAIITIVFSSLTASIGNLIVTAEERSRLKVFKCMQMVSFFLATYSVTCIYHLIHEFMILIWLKTDQYLLDEFTLLAILANFYLAVTLQPLWSYREATGLYRKTRYVMVIAALINLVLSIILGIQWGIGGIIFASFIAKLVTYVWYEPKLLFKEYFKESVITYFKSQIINVGLLITCICLTSFVTKRIEEMSVMMWFVKAIICSGIVMIVYLLRYCKTEEFATIKEKFLKRK